MKDKIDAEFYTHLEAIKRIAQLEHELHAVREIYRDAWEKIATLSVDNRSLREENKQQQTELEALRAVQNEAEFFDDIAPESFRKALQRAREAQK